MHAVLTMYLNRVEIYMIGGSFIISLFIYSLYKECSANQTINYLLAVWMVINQTVQENHKLLVWVAHGLRTKLKLQLR